ncbi:hypothetical protein ABC974_05165 [Sphingomonas oligophenolica]|uniref:Uncharacterized protein n=1 Tax=Sphingomonas oligophenolica TaxID=301154 RepID=A0ABU9XZQ5_9SPHN
MTEFEPWFAAASPNLSMVMPLFPAVVARAPLLIPAVPPLFSRCYSITAGFAGDH